LAIAITYDTDYMWEEDLLKFSSDFPILGKATYFLWKPFRNLSILNCELEPHPYFNQKKPWSDTIDEFENEWGKRGKILRPHSCVYSHMLGIELGKRGYLGISQATYIGISNITPYRHPWGIWELPIYYMDSMDFTMSFNWPELNHRPFDLNLIDRCIDSESLFVFDFHPLHIALNTSDFNQYQGVKDKILKREVSPFNLSFKGKGTRFFYEELLNKMYTRNIQSLTCEEAILLNL
jgi:hypothetical protein